MGYKTYRIILKPKTGIATPLLADTIWGHLANWIVLNKPEAKNDFFNLYVVNKPIVIFSDGFPALIKSDGKIVQYLPKPADFDILSYKYFAEKEENNAGKDKLDKKKIKKAEFVSLEVLKNAFNKSEGNENSFISYLFSEYNKDFEENQPVIDSVVILKNAVPRYGSSDTQIFGIEAKYLKQIKSDKDKKENEYAWTIFAKVDEQQNIIDKNILKEFLTLGYGKKKNVGFGQFEDIKVEEIDNLQLCQKPNAILCLSSFVPAQNDPTDGFWKTFVKYGKMGEVAYFALDEFKDAENKNPFKNPILLIKSGAVFKVKDEIPEYIGVSHLDGIRNEKDYVHPALSFVVGYKTFVSR